MYLNKVQLIGNLTREVELKALNNGNKIASFALATNRAYTTEGEKKEETEYHNVVVFGKFADVIKNYCHKGDQLYVEGRVQTRSWDATDGQKKYRTEIVLENFQFGRKSTAKPSDEEIKDPSDDNDNVEYPEAEINLEDIPF